MKKRILCFGDSNTWGYIPAGEKGRYSENIRWTGLLQDILGDGYAVVEEGMNGRTTAFTDNIEPGVCALDYIYPCLISHFPLNAVVVMLGTNDTKIRYHVKDTEIGRGMEELIFRIEDIMRRKNEYPEILIIAPAEISPKCAFDDFDRQSATKAGRLGEIYGEIAKRHGCGFLNAGEILKEPGCLGADGLHFSEKGHKILAEAVGDKLRSVLGKAQS